MKLNNELRKLKHIQNLTNQEQSMHRLAFKFEQADTSQDFGSYEELIFRSSSVCDDTKRSFDKDEWFETRN